MTRSRQTEKQLKIPLNLLKAIPVTRLRIQLPKLLPKQKNQQKKQLTLLPKQKNQQKKQLTPLLMPRLPMKHLPMKHLPMKHLLMKHLLMKHLLMKHLPILPLKEQL
jgi:hypothetical protein